MPNRIIISLLVLCTLGIGYEIYHDKIEVPNAIDKCNQIAIEFEKIRHPDFGDFEVTNLDITAYFKNITACLSDFL